VRTTEREGGKVSRYLRLSEGLGKMYILNELKIPDDNKICQKFQFWLKQYKISDILFQLHLIRVSNFVRIRKIK